MAPFKILRNRSPVSCFFCQTNITPAPKDPRCFKCPHCSCWNRFDANGDILSDEPAMHDEALNARSFARRGKKDRLPTTFGSSPFCNVCQSNQRLLINLLSSYLPPPDDPDYPQRMAMYDDYKASVEARYPPVCARCAPLVEEKIKERDNMARASALGRWLKESKGRDVKRQFSLSMSDRARLERELRWWRLRGMLCLATLGLALLVDGLGTLGLRPPLRFGMLPPFLPILAVVSILWTAWDPTYKSLRQAQLQGRKVQIRGRDQYVKMQIFVWSWRVLATTLIALSWWRPSWDCLSLRNPSPSRTSRIYFAVSLFLELLVAVRSFVILRLYRPPAVRLIDTSDRGRSTTPMPNLGPRAGAPSLHTTTRNQPDAALDRSLSPGPAASSAARQQSPVFGHPSLLYTIATNTAPTTSDDHDMDDISMDNDDADMEDKDPDAMDWTPTLSPSNEHQPRLPSGPPRNWRRGQPIRTQTDLDTGLESLLERTNLVEADSPRRLMLPRAWPGMRWWWLCAMLLVPLVGLLARAWTSRTWSVQIIEHSAEQ